MHPDEREVAGLRCSEVMADLSRYVDRELPPDRETQIEAHVTECQLCAMFGAHFADLIAEVRKRLGAPDPVPDDVAARLNAAVRSAE